MTRRFDESARRDLAAPSLFPEEFSAPHATPRSMAIRQVSASYARGWIATHHYTRTFPDSTVYAFAGYYGQALAGVITFGMGVSLAQYEALLPDIRQGEYLELTRLWSGDEMPRNTETRLIAGALNLLPPAVRLILSFADPSRGHVGTIYQASNFVYCGMSSGGKMMVDAGGIEKHPRLLGIYRMRHPEYAGVKTEELMRVLGFRYIDSSAKHRYARAVSRDKRQRRNDAAILATRALPYPKIEH